MNPDQDHDHVDLEQVLRDDPKGEHRAAVLARLNRMRDACIAARRELHDRASFRRLQATGAAVDAAITAMELTQVRRYSS